MNDSTGSTADTGSSFPKKRTVPRYSLIATVEIIEPACDTHFYGRLSEISRKGCYVDILNPVPTGTLIQILISTDYGTFMAAGKIIYVQDRMRMGIAFTEVLADQMAVLDSWFDELRA